KLIVLDVLNDCSAIRLELCFFRGGPLRVGKTNVVDQDRVRRYTVGAGGTVATLRRNIGRHVRSGHYVSHSDAKAKGRQALKLVGYRALRESGAVREQHADKFNSYILPDMRG